MNPEIELHAIDREIRAAREAVERLKALGEEFPALARNSERILASLKMLELNVSDLFDLGVTGPTRPATPAKKPKPHASRRTAFRLGKTGR
jgi:hypothetical protein